VDRLLNVFVPLGVALVLYFIFCFLFRVREVDRLLRFILRKQPLEE